MYLSPKSPFHNTWKAASSNAAVVAGKGEWYARRLREWTWAFIRNPAFRPIAKYGSSTKSRIDDEDLAAAIKLHLQSVGKYVRALDIVHFLDRPEVQTQFGLKKSVSLSTAQRWMKRMGYRWMKTPKGQYVDGHEREDVVAYRQHVFLP
ncbi:hypothetical protein OF83DRAFT_1060295, partial [Amylostereum chailletii]